MTTEDIDWKKMHKGFNDALSVSRRTQLGGEWGIDPNVLRRLGLGWDVRTKSYTFPERNGKKQIVGILLRQPETGKKRTVLGSQRGLSIGNKWNSHAGPIYVPEGVSDTAVLLAHGLNAVGRPSCSGGVEMLAELLQNCKNQIIIVGEHDEKSDGSWPGKDGAIKTASQLSQRLARSVMWTLPPNEFKDVREFASSLKEDDHGSW